jgi:hypothetical protein
MIQPISHPDGLLFYIEYMKTKGMNREQKRRLIWKKGGPPPTHDLNCSDKYARFLRLRRPKY